MSLIVRASSCRTCIYHPDNPLDLEELERQVTDDHGHMANYRACHHHEDGRCCRGFWNRHRANCTPLLIAERLDRVAFSDDGDNYPLDVP